MNERGQKETNLCCLPLLTKRKQKEEENKIQKYHKINYVINLIIIHFS